MEATQQISSSGNVNELKLADGIYFTDYRKTAPVNNCQTSFLQKKSTNEIPKHPELIIALFKENDIRASKLIYSITELKAMENYQEDPDFVLAVKEDYEVLLRVLEFEVRALEELERLDRYNPLLKKHSVQSIKDKITQYTQESLDFEDELKAIEAKKNPVPEEKVVENVQIPNADNDANSVYI